MLEARLEQASILKRLLDAIKELVTDANFECGDEGLKLQAMDNSHVALVAVQLEPEGFGKYRCDRPMPLGVNLGSLTKVLKCAKDDDRVTLKANDNADVLNLVYEARNSDRIAEYEMKLMEIDIDTLGIPETDYDATVVMQSGEFARIVRDLSALGESVKIEVTKEGIRFSADGEAANGSVLLKATEGARERYKDLDGKDAKTKVKKEKGDKPRKRKKTDDADVKMEDADEDVEEDDGGEKLFKPASEDGEAEKEDDEEAGSDGEEESDGASKKRKRSSQPKKSKNDDGDSSGGVMVELGQSVNLTFSLKYLVNFSKSTSLANTVTLKMSNEVPLLVRRSENCFSCVLIRSGNRFTISSTRAISSITLHPKLETTPKAIHNNGFR
ncbi:proliferating cell nuclear antigen [Rhizoctonia solani AG-1 IA]|uniref:DNA sliding clamp PCNA n=1 Tax=Thanatephorus cucumeris (strain AG1-IA) TaxID=983506 RepID=L8WT01_THACA|nr:proliferating cell nuclear antigen [Rhizoctonia solani AG-1 IA]